MLRKSLVLALVLVLTGCSTLGLTKPTGVVTFDRQDFVNVYEKSKVLVDKVIAPQIVQACVAGAISPSNCAAAGLLYKEWQKLVLDLDAKIANPETEIDRETMFKLLGLLVDLAL